MEHSLYTGNNIPNTRQQNEYDIAFLKIYAENDYLIARYLLVLNTMLVPALFHIQQCVEKYLKAYLSLKNDSRLSRTHDTSKLRKYCADYDDFFNDENLKLACKALHVFAFAGRYPTGDFRQVGSSIPNDLNFLDEFVYTMRAFFLPSENINLFADGIRMTYNWSTKSSSRVGQPVASAMFEAFLQNNPYSDRIIHQFHE